MRKIPETERSPPVVFTIADELLIHNPAEEGIAIDPEKGDIVTPVDNLNVPLVNVRKPADSDEKLFDVTSSMSPEVDPTFTFIV